MRAGSKLVGYGQFFRQVAVKNVVGVIFNAREEVIIGRAEQFFALLCLFHRLFLFQSYKRTEA